MARFERYIKNEGLDVSTLLSVAAVTSILVNLYKAISGYLTLSKHATRDKVLETTLRQFLKDKGETALNFKIYTLDIGNVVNMMNCGDMIVISNAMFECGLTNDELCAVVLHEYGHFKNLDIYSDFVRRNAFVVLALSLAAQIANPLLSIFAFFTFAQCGNAVKKVMFKRHELAADEMATRLGYGEILATGLEKLEAMGTPPTGIVSRTIDSLGQLLDEHPTTERRVAKILKDVKVYKYPQYVPQAIAKQMPSTEEAEDIVMNSSLLTDEEKHEILGNI